MGCWLDGLADEVWNMHPIACAFRVLAITVKDFHGLIIVFLPLSCKPYIDHWPFRFPRAADPWLNQQVRVVMKLTFSCPKTRKRFSSVHYALLPGHSIVATSGGCRTLEGMVELTVGCPECGQKHLFPVGQIMCPLQGDEQ